MDLFDICWDFKKTIEYIKEVKLEYKRVLASFSFFENKEKREYVKKIREEIYNLKMCEWQKDRIWEYLNDDETLETLILISDRQKK